MTDALILPTASPRQCSTLAGCATFFGGGAGRRFNGFGNFSACSSFSYSSGAGGRAGGLGRLLRSIAVAGRLGATCTCRFQGVGQQRGANCLLELVLQQIPPCIWIRCSRATCWFSNIYRSRLRFRCRSGCRRGLGCGRCGRSGFCVTGKWRDKRRGGRCRSR